MNGAPGVVGRRLARACLIPAWIAVAAVLGSLPPAGAQAPTEPLTVSARYREERTASRIVRTVEVQGETRFPNGTRLAVGIRGDGEQEYAEWRNAMVADGKYATSFGTAEGSEHPLLPGAYVVETWIIWERQRPSIQQRIRDTDVWPKDEGARCKTKSLFVSCEVLAFEPGPATEDDPALRRVLEAAHALLSQAKVAMLHGEAVAPDRTDRVRLCAPWAALARTTARALDEEQTQAGSPYQQAAKERLLAGLSDLKMAIDLAVEVPDALIAAAFSPDYDRHVTWARRFLDRQIPTPVRDK